MLSHISVILFGKAGTLLGGEGSTLTRSPSLGGVGTLSRSPCLGEGYHVQVTRV